MRRADLGDMPVLLALMTEFYAESGYVLDRELAAAAFTDVLADQSLGYVWILEADSQNAGYAVLTLRYAMEYGGRIACLDDLYVSPSYRNRSIAKTALTGITEFCRDVGLRAITVEVGHDNAPARTVYHRAGFQEASGRTLLALPLAAPTHVL